MNFLHYGQSQNRKQHKIGSWPVTSVYSCLDQSHAFSHIPQAIQLYVSFPALHFVGSPICLAVATDVMTSIPSENCSNSHCCRTKKVFFFFLSTRRLWENQWSYNVCCLCPKSPRWLLTARVENLFPVKGDLDIYNIIRESCKIIKLKSTSFFCLNT